MSLGLGFRIRFWCIKVSIDSQDLELGNRVKVRSQGQGSRLDLRSWSWVSVGFGS